MQKKGTFYDHDCTPSQILLLCLAKLSYEPNFMKTRHTLNCLSPSCSHFGYTYDLKVGPHGFKVVSS
jgi:hypothetical protein